MGRPRKDNKIIATTVRLKPDIHQKISDIAEKNYRSISSQIEMIIDEYLEKLEG